MDLNQINNGGQEMKAFCPVCGAWKKYNSGNMIAMFMEGFSDDSPEVAKQKEMMDDHLPFIDKHMECITKSTDPDIEGVVFLYEDDDRFNKLDKNKEEI